MIKKVKNTVMFLLILLKKKFLELFNKKNCKNQTTKSLKLKILSREKAINCIFNGKATIICLLVGLIKKT